MIMVLTVREVRENQAMLKYQGAKINKNAKIILNCCMQTAYNS